MFGHLQSEDFIDYCDGVSLSTAKRAHIDSCEECSDRLADFQEFNRGLTTACLTNTEIPEPDWDNFRSRVRDGMISRAAQRQSAVRRWTGWRFGTATAWALSLVFAVGLTALLTRALPTNTAVVNNTPVALDVFEPELMEIAVSESEIGVWSQTGIFEELAHLEGAETERLLEQLQTATAEDSSEQ